MTTNELAFYSSTEPVDELLRRQSFLGVIVHAVSETLGLRLKGQQRLSSPF
jgi:hypothetical protein